MEADREQGGKKQNSEPSRRSVSLSYLVGNGNGSRRVCGWQTRKTWLERAASARRPRGDQRSNADETRTLVVQVESGTVSTCTEEETDHGALTYVGGVLVQQGGVGLPERQLNFLT